MKRMAIQNIQSMLHGNQPVCVECGGMGVMTSGRKLHPHNPMVANRIYFACPCGAWAGAHEGTGIPRGRPGNEETRSLRSKAHRLFDKRWGRDTNRSKHVLSKARHKAYAWLGRELGIPASECHFGFMDRDMLKRAIALLTESDRGGK